MAKQAHSLLNRGKGREWSRALDVPREVIEQPEFTDPNEPVELPPQPTPMPKPKPNPQPPSPVDKSNMSTLVTAVIVNFNTKALLRQAYRTFHSFYPDIHIIMVDNHSTDGSTEWVQEMGGRPHITSITMDRNVGHGPAMNKAIRQVDTPYVLTLDTDTETIKGGFLEQMIAKMKEDDKLYAIGWKRWVDRLSGVPLEWHLGTQPPDKFIPYIHPSCGLYRVSLYHTLSPFFHHGAPCLDNMREAQRRKLTVASFPINDYVLHLKAGTRRMYNGRWDPKTGDRRETWKKKGNWPI